MRIRRVGGNIKEYTGGDYNIYSRGDIIETAGGTFTETAPEIIYGDAEPHPVKENPISLAVVEFRPASTPEAEKYDSSFGFDWMRIDDSPIPNFDTPFFNTLNQGGYYDVETVFKYKRYESKKDYYQGLKKEYQDGSNSYPITFRKENQVVQGNEDDSYYYYVPYLTLYSRQYVNSLPNSTEEGYKKPSYEAFLSLITEVNEDVDKLDFEYNTDIFEVSLSTPLDTKKSAKKKHSCNVKITCKKDFDTEQSIKVYALPKGSREKTEVEQRFMRTLAGKLKVLPNSEKHRKKKKILIIQIKTDVDNKSEIQEGKFNKSQTPFLYKFLHQAYVEPEISYYPENHEDSYVDLTNDPHFKKESSKYLTEVTLQDGSKETQFKDMTGTEFYKLTTHLEEKYIPADKKDCFVIFCFGIAKGDSAGETSLRRERSVLFKATNTTTAVHESCHGLGVLYTFTDPSYPDKNGKYFFEKYATSNLMDYSDTKPFLYKWQWDILQSRIEFKNQNP